MRRKIRSNILSAALLVVGGGCAPAVPPAVMIASQAIDGISYVATGKSGSDHVLSAALEQDCAVHRVVTGGAVCRVRVGEVKATDPDVQIASLAPDPTLEAVPLDDDAIEREAAHAAGETSGDVPPAPVPPRPSGEERGAEDIAHLPSISDADRGWWLAPTPRSFVVLETYAIRREADRAAARLAPLANYPNHRPKVVSTLASGGPVYRLVLGPFAPREAKALRERFRGEGFASAGALPGCDAAVTLACVDAN